MPDSSFFQITATAPSPGMCEILCAPFQEWSLYFPQPSDSPKSKPRWPSKPNVLGACCSSARPLAWGARFWALTLCSLERTYAIVIILLFVGHTPGVMGLVSPLPTFVSVVPFSFCCCCCRRHLLLLFRPFSSIFAL